MKKPFRIFSQWRKSTCGWCFVPFSAYGTEDFCGFVLFNFCFEWPKTAIARQIHGDLA